jgi:NADH:flavin oxidoreductase / NADH oxidase family
LYGLLQIHGAHGYLLEEFIKTSTNKRTDKYGVHVLCDCSAQWWRWELSDMRHVQGLCT